MSKPTEKTLKELWDSLDVEELKKQNKQATKQKPKPAKKKAKLTKKEKQEQADGAENEKWQNEQYAKQMKQQAAAKKKRDKAAEKLLKKMTKKEKRELADNLTHDLLEQASLDAHTLKLKPNTNRTQIRNDLAKLQYVLEYESVIGIFPKIRQLACDLEYMQDQPNASQQKIAQNILMPLFCTMLTNFFLTGGSIDAEKL